jgi:hypothetical protein
MQSAEPARSEVRINIGFFDEGHDNSIRSVVRLNDARLEQYLKG